MHKPYRPIRTNNFLLIQKWARDYQKHGTMPQPIVCRFAIGLYQLGQARGWDNGAPAGQGYASAALHWIMVGEALNLPTEYDLAIDLTPEGWPDIKTIKGSPFNTDALLATICRSQQQIIYAIHSSDSTRKSRYDHLLLSKMLASLILGMIVVIPPSARAASFHDEMQILVGDLVKKGN